MSLYPALFIGHGSPMNAIESNEFSLEWKKMAAGLPRPDAIVCISAHWVTAGTYITSMEKPRTIHDFYGFPEELYQIRYPAAGNPELAKEITGKTAHDIKSDLGWGLDHGCWSVLHQMFPNADIPVLQISLDSGISPQQHYELGQKLKWLREHNIMVLGSGNIVHNLGTISWTNQTYPWAEQFDAIVKEKIMKRDFDSLANYNQFGNIARQAVPTSEHYLPMLYVLGLVNPESRISFYCEKIALGSISMRSIMVEE